MRNPRLKAICTEYKKYEKKNSVLFNFFLAKVIYVVNTIYNSYKCYENKDSVCITTVLFIVTYHMRLIFFSDFLSTSQVLFQVYHVIPVSSITCDPK